MCAFLVGFPFNVSLPPAKKSTSIACHPVFLKLHSQRTSSVLGCRHDQVPREALPFCEKVAKQHLGWGNSRSTGLSNSPGPLTQRTLTRAQKTAPLEEVSGSPGWVFALPTKLKLGPPGATGIFAGSRWGVCVDA